MRKSKYEKFRFREYKKLFKELYALTETQNNYSWKLSKKIIKLQRGAASGL